MEVKVNGIYRHFKGTIHKVIAIAKHSESLEDYVIYTHEDTNEVWARPYDSFVSKVDHHKYPTIKQEYRFELIPDVE